jgi:hypothetical protein
VLNRVVQERRRFSSVTGLDTRNEMRRSFAETQKMITFSAMVLDRRVRSLEDAVANLQTCVERPEVTH